MWAGRGRLGLLGALMAASPMVSACGSAVAPSTSQDAVHRGLQGLILHPQKPAPALALRNYTGGVVNLASFRGRAVLVTFLRSEERRVGKECRSRWSASH